MNDIGGSMDGSGADPSVADAVVTEILDAGGAAIASHDSVDEPESAAAIVVVATDPHTVPQAVADEVVTMLGRLGII